MKHTLIIAASSLIAVLPASSAITVQAHYKLGESGTLGSNNVPLDTSGYDRHFLYGYGGTISADSIAAPTSSLALHIPAFGGYYGTQNNISLVDNFGIVLWARTSQLGQANYTNVFSGAGQTPGGFDLRLSNGRWCAAMNGQAWIGGDPATGGGVAATVAEWVNLAIVRDVGITTFYVNGLAVPGSSAELPFGPTTTADAHLGVNPNGVAHFNGDVDEVRIFTFSPGEFTSNDLIPEPSVGVLFAAGLAGAFMRRKRNESSNAEQVVPPNGP